MSEPIENVLPNSISNLTCTIENSDGERYNVTTNVVSISIFESIFEFFIHAEVVMLDVSALADTIPIIGQEKFSIYYKKNDQEYELDFFINGITERSEVSESATTYTLYLSTKEEILNSTITYSKAYSGTQNQIIRKILKDSFGRDIDIFDDSNGAIDYIVPMKRPVSAIKDLLSTSLDTNNSPFMLFQTVNGNGRLNLRSLVNLISNPNVIQLDYGSTSTESGNGYRDVAKNQYRLNELIFRSGFDTYNNIASGSYSGTVNQIDLNKKSYEKKLFDYTKGASKTLNGIGITKNKSYSVLNDSLVFNEMYDSRVTNYFTNKHQFNNLNNLYRDDSFSRASINSYKGRIDTQIATGFGNSIPIIQAGSKVLLSFPKSTMTLDNNSDFLNDEIISGVYITTSIRHYIKNETYTMSYEFMREGVTNREDGQQNNLIRSGRR